MAVDASGLVQAEREWAVDLGRRLGAATVTALQSRVGRKTGELHDSIEASEPVEEGDTVVVEITVGAAHGKWRNEGTGIYGPTGQRIRGNPLLAFDWPAAGGLVIVHSVAGAPGDHWWDETLKQWGSIVASVA